MRRLASRLKPAAGLAHIAHLLLVLLLPLMIFVFVSINVVEGALIMILLSKWRMFAVKLRHWPASIRANALDLIVGFSFVSFMVHADSQAWQLAWAVLYGIWLLFIKPHSSVALVSLQAVIGQTVGLLALYMAFSSAPGLLLVLATGIICYISARHFLLSFDEAHIPLLSYLWGYFGAALAWVLSHWLLFYPRNYPLVAQPMLLLTVIGLGLATLYYLDRNDRLSPFLRRQFVFVMVAVVFVVLVLSDWGDRAL